MNTSQQILDKLNVSDLQHSSNTKQLRSASQQTEPINPFTDEELNSVGHRAKQVCNFSSLSIFVYDAKR